MSSSASSEPKQKVFQGKAYIPDDHIQLISKYFQGANLNLNFTLDEDESCERVCKKRQKHRSRSRCRRRHKKRSIRRKSKRCKCCKCHEDRCELPKSCYSEPHKCPPKKQVCCQPCCKPEPQIVPKSCCCEPLKCPRKKPICCEKIDPCTPVGSCKPAKTECCCNRPCEPEPDKICCCCIRPCVDGKGKNHAGPCADGKGKNHADQSGKDNTSSKGVDGGSHKHTSCCCKCNKVEGKKENGETKMEGSKNDKQKTDKRGASSKQPTQPKSSKSSDSTSSTSTGSDTTNVKQVYVANRVSRLERDEVYGRYWYHRPPLENTITHCDDDYLPPLDNQNNQFNEDVYNEPAPKLPETSAIRQTTGRCMACKEPMCLHCKMNICDCDCEKPNFVICNPCKQRLTPRPPKKPCLPKKPKPKTAQPNNSGGYDETMVMLPLLASMQASMQGNSNFQQCNYC